MTSHDARLRARVDDLTHALEVGGDRLDPDVVEQVRAAVTGVQERLALGVDHRIVALVGGTGSGKSSLFNRISRLDFADVGARRPTTARVTACSWSDGAGPLLDWLEVEPERRITHDGLLDGKDDLKLGGLVLLDLPDHDSIEPAHRAVVDRIIPLVDLLVWVVDPQKYADDALHSGYLQRSGGLEGSMVVAVNHIDTVPQGRRETLVEDMDRLLTEDGLSGVHVTQVSARTGEGIDGLYSLLEQAVARRSVAAGRAAGELDRAGRLLVEETPSEVPWSVSGAIPETVDAISRACGLHSVAGELSAAVRNGYGRPEFAPPQQDSVALARSAWIDRAGAAMRPRWRQSLEEAIAPAAHIVSETRRALAKLPLDTRGPASARTVRVWTVITLVLAVIAGVLAVIGSAHVVTLPYPWLPVCAVAAVVAALAAVFMFLLGRQMRRALAARRGQQVIASGLGAIERVVAQTLQSPTQEILDAHRRVRELAQEAQDAEPVTPLAPEPNSSTDAVHAAASTGRG